MGAAQIRARARRVDARKLSTRDPQGLAIGHPVLCSPARACGRGQPRKRSASLIGARAAGWDALPEQSGQTPDGQDWRADVLCRRPGQPWSIALEAQVQLQGEEAYRKRQERFAASGIRALWLVAHEPAALKSYWDQPDRDLPAFRARTW